MKEYGVPVEILLIEDNEGDIVLTKKAFEREGYPCRISVCRNGYEALDHLYRRGKYGEALRPDLIIMDLNMPGISGQETLTEIKSDRSLASIPVIILTTSESQEDVQTCYQLQASSYIRKPVDFHEFREVIHRLQDYWFRVVKFPQQA
ncbi:MAG: response regulator [Bacteroidota bacterium]